MFVPDDLRQILLRSNGPAVGLQIMLGIGVPHWDIEDSISNEWAERGWPPIAADGCGDYYVVPTRQQFGQGYPVNFNDQMDLDAPNYIAASSVSRFFFCLAHDEYRDTGWPFDKDVTLAEDPEILRFSGVPLPWEEDER